MFLTVKEIRKHFGEGDSRVEVLNGIDAEIEKGEICVLLGPSGSGKSTLLNIIGGIDSADSGYIAINGEKTADMNEKRLTLYRRKHLGYIFQQYNLIPNLNIKENVEIGAYLSDNPLDTDEILKTLGLYEDVSYRFSQWDPADRKKYIGTPEQWDEAQGIMKKILDHLEIPYKVGVGEAAFYGPKLR